MPGRGRVPTSVGASVEAEGPSSAPQVDPLLGLQASAGGGNGAVAELACDPEADWEQSGNLRGAPPVRNRHRPPNSGIVEDEAVFRQRRSAALAVKQEQQALADSYCDSDGNVTDNRFWFAQVYRFVTQHEVATADAATYYYPSYVMQCVRYFHQLYEDNARAADAGGTVEDHWREAFEHAEDAYISPEFGAWGVAFPGPALADAIAHVYAATSSMVRSMQAHIRYDLPRAEAWVFNTFYAHMPCAQIQDFQADFQSMQGVFELAAADMNPVLAEKTGIPTSLMPRMAQDLAMSAWFDADMANERADTWQRAEGLVEGGLGGSGPYREGASGELVGDATTADHMSGLQGLSPGLRPTMDGSAEDLDDDDARSMAARGGLADLPTSQRIRMLRALISGATFNDDEASIQDILNASLAAGDVVVVVDGASPWELLADVDGDDHQTLRRFLQRHYYGRTSHSVAVTLVERCLQGWTSGWEEDLVADLLTIRTDARAIVTELGGGSFNSGLNRLEWQLTGEAQRRVAADFGESR